MSRNVLAICVGNTRTRFGTIIEGKLECVHILSNTNINKLESQIERSYRPIHALPRPVVVMSSTDAHMAARVADQVQRQLRVQLLRVEKDLPIPIGRQLDPEAIVGEDRLLNAAAAYDVLRQASVVVDAGTALTVDFVDGAGTFHGGAIAPGASLMLESLAERTAQLPEVEMAAPKAVIGHNTVEAIRSGVFHGIRGMVRELTEQIAEVAGIYPMVIATGGDAELLFEGYELVDRVVPDLILLGMKLTVTGPGPSE